MLPGAASFIPLAERSAVIPQRSARPARRGLPLVGGLDDPGDGRRVLVASYGDGSGLDWRWVTRVTQGTRRLTAAPATLRQADELAQTTAASYLPAAF